MRCDRQGRNRVVPSREVEGRCQVTDGRSPPGADVRHLYTEAPFEEEQGGGEVEGARGDEAAAAERRDHERSEEHTSELQSPCNLVCRLLLEKKKKKK